MEKGLKMRVKKRKTSYHPPEGEEVQGLKINEPAIAYRLVTPNGPFKLLGLAESGSSATNQKEYFLSVIRGGLPRHSLDSLMDVTGLNVYEMADILDTTDRTLRRHEGSVKLSREHSERALELAQLYSRGEEVFGDLPVFRQWMDSSIPALGGKKPKSFLDTSLGIGMLMAELGRIEHGVFA